MRRDLEFSQTFNERLQEENQKMKADVDDLKRYLDLKDKEKKELNRMILKMGINVQDGFVYFNEMLYRVMRAQYVTGKNKMKLNSKLMILEIATQYKISELTMISKE